MSADLSHVDAWLFDLDDTLYPTETRLMDLIRERITGFVMRITGMDRDEARRTQRAWFEAHGASLPGILANHDISVAEFLDEIHDVPLDCIPPDPLLDQILARLPGRKLVFTNGSAGHAARVLERIGVGHHFEAVFHIESANMLPKPARATYDRMIEVFGITPERAVFFEDSERNLETAAELGMTTVLVGPHAMASTEPFIDHRTPDLVPFLTACRVGTAAGAAA